jgi:hypothetical protein
MLKPGQRAGRRSLSSLGKAASHRQRSYDEEGADDHRSASKGEKEGFISFAFKEYNLHK